MFEQIFEEGFCEKTDFFEHQQEIMLLWIARMKLDSWQWNSGLYYKHITIVIDTASVVSNGRSKL